MSKALKLFVVESLETLDTWLDQLPWIDRDLTTGKLRVYKQYGLGCSIGLAELGVRLDKRWNTHVWLHEEDECYD